MQLRGASGQANAPARKCLQIDGFRFRVAGSEGQARRPNMQANRRIYLQGCRLRGARREDTQQAYVASKLQDFGAGWQV